MKMDKKIFLGLPLGVIVLLLASIVFDAFVESKLDLVSKIILIVILILSFFLLKAKINLKSDCPEEPKVTGAEIYTEVELELDHEELQKEKEGEKISPFGRKTLELKISGEGKVIKRLALYTFPYDVKFSDVEALRLQIGAMHATWEDLYPDYTAFPDNKTLVAFGTEGVGETGMKMVACRRGLSPITAIFKEAKFQEGTVFPLVIEVRS